MLPSRRKELRFQLPPSNNELWAIGVVAVQWTHIEMYMLGFVHALIPDSSAPERQVFDTTRAFDQRIDQWEVLIRRDIAEPHASNLLAVTQRIKNAQQMRDRIMHSTWSGKLTPDNEDLQARGVFNWSKPHARFEWNLDFGKLMYVARTLDAILIDILEKTGWTQLSATRPNQFTTLGDALQRIRRIPNPSS